MADDGHSYGLLAIDIFQPLFEIAHQALAKLIFNHAVLPTTRDT